MAYVKVRRIGEKRFYFVEPRGGLNRLRIHAARFDDIEKAQAFIDANGPRNPEFEFRPVKA